MLEVIYFVLKQVKWIYLFDLDLTSLYPSIIMTINIGKETYVGRIIDADDRNNRLGYNDLKCMNYADEMVN